MSYIAAQTERNKEILEYIYEILRSEEWGYMQHLSTLHMLVPKGKMLPKTQSVDAEIRFSSTSVEAEHQSLTINAWVPPTSRKDSQENTPFPSSPDELIGIQSVLNMLIRKAGLRTNDGKVFLSHCGDDITKEPSIPGLVDLRDSIRIGTRHSLIMYHLAYHADDRSKLLKAAKELLEELGRPAQARSR